MKHKAYICSKDAIWHIPDDAGGVRIYFSKLALLKAKGCCKLGEPHGCTIVEIEIDVPDEIEDN